MSILRTFTSKTELFGGNVKIGCLPKKMLKIVHCFIDEKFVKTAIDEFEYINNYCDNKYIHITISEKESLTYIKNLNQINYLSTNLFLGYLKREKCNYVILHSLESLPFVLISQIPKEIKVVWFAWGYDIYGKVLNKPFIPIPDLYHKETKNLLKPSLRERFLLLRPYVSRIFKSSLIKRAISRIDYFSGIIPEEYELMKSVPYFRAKQIDFRYQNLYNEIDYSLLTRTSSIRGMNIMIGNSCDPSNNHADIFKKMRDFDLKDRRIIVPLSYGGTNRYREQIKRIGHDMWGDSFVAIEKYMSFKEYEQELSSCGFRIFGHERQQALGNVNMAFRNGCKVFLSSSSLLYKHYQNSGLKFFSIQDNLTSYALSTLLAKDESEMNRKISIELRLTSKQIERLYKMIEVFEQNVKSD